MARCKACVYATHRERYASKEGKKKLKGIKLKNRTKQLQRWRDLKEDTPCTDCNQQYPYYVMQFDHVRGEKVEHVSTLIARCHWKLVEEEVKKCEVVCSNCHAERTHNRHESNYTTG